MQTPTSSTPSPMPSSKRTARMRPSGSSAGAARSSSAASPAGAPRLPKAPGSTGPRTSSSCGRFATSSTSSRLRAARGSRHISARSSTRTGTGRGPGAKARIGEVFAHALLLGDTGEPFESIEYAWREHGEAVRGEDDEQPWDAAPPLSGRGTCVEACLAEARYVERRVPFLDLPGRVRHAKSMVDAGDERGWTPVDDSAVFRYVRWVREDGEARMVPPDLRLRTVYLVELVCPPDRSVVIAEEGLRGRLEDHGRERARERADEQSVAGRPDRADLHPAHRVRPRRAHARSGAARVPRGASPRPRLSPEIPPDSDGQPPPGPPERDAPPPTGAPHAGVAGRSPHLRSAHAPARRVPDPPASARSPPGAGAR